MVAAISTVPILLPAAAGLSGDFRSARLASWLITLVLMLGFAFVVGHGVTGVWRGVLIDERNKISTSRLQLALWTAIILSAYLEGVLANVGLRQHNAIHISVPQTLWAALGISTISLAASPVIVRYRTTGTNKLMGNPSPRDASWRDTVTGEEKDLEDMVDIGKLQMVLVTIVLVVAYGIVLGYMFYTRGPRIGFLPKVNDAFAILLAISHGGYLAKKGMAKLPVTTKSG
ncbi:MAG TPA: hypothetical protein VKR79_04370 [Gaiellaceae bacterium]|nr:hypothetical protein [Gaiellaceae bacterium]